MKIKTYIYSLLSLFCILLSTAATASSTDSRNMTYIEYRFVSPQIKEGTFEASSRKIWRVGYRFLRLEEAPDPVEQIHGLIIGKAPDHYMINLYTKSGQHIVDRAETIDIHVPVFQHSDLPEKLQKLEFGHELTYFKANNPESTGNTIINGISCSSYQLLIDGFKIVLHARGDSGDPYQLDISKDDISYGVRYLAYQKDLKPNFDLFEVPAEVNVIDVN